MCYNVKKCVVVLQTRLQEKISKLFGELLNRFLLLSSLPGQDGDSSFNPNNNNNNNRGFYMFG